MNYIVASSLWDALLAVPAGHTPIHMVKDMFGWTVQYVETVWWVNTHSR